MKKTVSVLISIILMLMFCIGLTACVDNGSSNGNNNPSANSPSPEPFNVDLAGYVANIGTAKALGISKEVGSSVSPMSTRSTNSGIQFLSHTPLVSNKDTEDKNYIVMSTTDYDANAPEADKTGLTKVTFTKIVTENVTTETTGTKYIIANESSISIFATTGFKYTVYYNDALIYNEVQDNDANDKEPKEGVIVLDNLIDGMEYKVNYKGIGVETTITQDDINGEIDKLYVLNNYTFISFVPQGESLRPEDKYLDFDNNGIASYDRTNYFSSTDRQSFVIDNSTGLVYHIKDTQISEIKNNLLIVNNKIFDMTVNDNDELQFTQVIQNETITVYDYFKDKYNNIYIYNNFLEATDFENNVVYYTSQKYFYSQENEVVYVDFGENIGSIFGCPGECIELAKIKENFEHKKINNTDKFTFKLKISYSKILSHIENGFLYMMSYEPFYYMFYCKIKTDTLEIDNRWFGNWADEDNLGYTIAARPVDSDNVLLIKQNTNEKIFNLYHVNVWDYVGDTYRFDFDKATLILENCALSIDGCGDYYNENAPVFRKTTFTETIYYKIIIDENGNPKAVNSETYVAPEKETITLQPLNK